jgi:hypothetical protein
MRRHNEDFFFFKEEVKKRILKDEKRRYSQLFDCTFRISQKVQCKIQVSNGPKNTISKI